MEVNGQTETLYRFVTRTAEYAVQFPEGEDQSSCSHVKKENAYDISVTNAVLYLYTKIGHRPGKIRKPHTCKGWNQEEYKNAEEHERI